MIIAVYLAVLPLLLLLGVSVEGKTQHKLYPLFKLLCLTVSSLLILSGLYVKYRYGL